jgi:GNAT superfamily N-acetyltransferase
VSVEIVLAEERHFKDTWLLLAEYFEAVQVIVRDSPEAVRKLMRDGASGLWLAYVDGAPAGCIVLRPITAGDGRSGEVKRLYVKPAFRRMGIAQRLLSALECHAKSKGFETLYLDSTDDLREAVAFYRRSGYNDCERYNDNPQATIFLRKALALPVRIREFQPGDEAAFRLLNEAWISKLFKLEEKDIQTLQFPGKYILSEGGRIYMACRGPVQVGCCALLNLHNGSYELSKMGVAETERGRGVGRKLIEYVVAEARRLGIQRLYLETNHALENAIHLYESAGFKHLRPEDVKASPYARADVYMEMLLG